jgi:hypothetical protein
MCSEFFVPLRCDAAYVSGQPIVTIFMVKQYKKNGHMTNGDISCSETSQTTNIRCLTNPKERRLQDTLSFYLHGE